MKQKFRAWHKTWEEMGKVKRRLLCEVPSNSKYYGNYECDKFYRKV